MHFFDDVTANADPQSPPPVDACERVTKSRHPGERTTGRAKDDTAHRDAVDDADSADGRVHDARQGCGQDGDADERTVSRDDADDADDEDDAGMGGP